MGCRSKRGLDVVMRSVGYRDYNFGAWKNIVMYV